VLSAQQMETYWVKVESMFLLWAWLMQNLAENLTGFKSKPFLPLYLKSSC
jgi:hypothetical protein